MSIRNAIMILSACAFLAGCSTGRYGDTYAFANETTTHKGFRYLVGRGVQQDRAKAVQYFQQAANAGDPFAQNELGYLYAAGKGVAKNEEIAFKWYKRAAQKDLASAQYNLGLFYLHGIGTTQDQAEGIRWIEKAAQAGFEPARLTLAQNKTS